MQAILIISNSLFVTDIPDGRIVGLAIRKTLFNPKRKYDYSPIFKAIELLVHDSKKTSPLRNVNPGSAYAMLTVKGNVLFISTDNKTKKINNKIPHYRNNSTSQMLKS